MVDWCRATNAAVVRGNHDKAAVGLTDLEWFNPVAKEAALWTAGMLTEENRLYLATLPIGPSHNPGLRRFFTARRRMKTNISLNPPMSWHESRSYPIVFRPYSPSGRLLYSSKRYRLPVRSHCVYRGNSAYLVNPGSVGQPRDHDPRAAFALYDSETRLVQYERTEYDVSATARKIVDAGLPEVLGLRLFRGA